MFYSTTHPSPVGLLTLACDGDNLVGLWIEGQKYFGASISETMLPQDSLPLFQTVKAWLDRYFSGQKPLISELSLKPAGREFRQAVWRILCKIPYGEVVTYGDIAKGMADSLGKITMSGQAVGGAVSHNPISIIIPCHRVIGTDGSLTGYAGGFENKLRLLELEGVDTSRLFVPPKGRLRRNAP